MPAVDVTAEVENEEERAERFRTHVDIFRQYTIKKRFDSRSKATT